MVVVICTRCRQPKPKSEFYKDSRVSKGIQSHCKACVLAKAKDRYAKDGEFRKSIKDRSSADYRAVRAGAIRIYGGSCVQCGSVDDLQFDHVDGGGEVHRQEESHRQYLRRIVSTGERLKDVRLQLLCTPCHQTKSTANLVKDDLGMFA